MSIGYLHNILVIGVLRLCLDYILDLGPLCMQDADIR